MKRVLLAMVLLVGLALPTIAARPQPAAAAPNPVVTALCLVITFGISGCEPFDVAPATCSITQVGASVPEPGQHAYHFEEVCGGGVPAHSAVNASYNVATKEAQEKVKAVSGDWTIVAAWTCSADPWTYSGAAPACHNTFGRISARGGGQPPSVDWTKARFPVSAARLDALERATLNGRLQNALRRQTQQPQQGPTSQGPIQFARHNFPILEQGETGEAVTSLQYLLREHGLDVDVDGEFGPQTAAAVLTFQQQKGLATNVVVGRTTWHKLAVEVREGSEGEAVRAVQSQLAARGLDVSIDGAFGPQTSAAVRQYQRAIGLTVDGTVTLTTWAALLDGK